MIISRCTTPAQNTRYAQALTRSLLLALGPDHVIALSLFGQDSEKGRRTGSHGVTASVEYGQPAILFSELRAAAFRPFGSSQRKTTWLALQSGCFIAP